jgi:type 1 fimbriae regulatory protein FimE
MQKQPRHTPFSAKLPNQPPKKPKNKDQRSREYLTQTEVDRLRKAARSSGRHGHRDDTLILILFRHGLRVSEAIALRWDQVDLQQGLLHVQRLKNGTPSTHPLRGIELRALRQLQRDYPDIPYLFASERQAPLTDRSVRHIIARAGTLAKFSFTIHPHMLRHSTGFYLANKGEDTRAIQSYLGHANIKNTVIYTELSPQRFKDFWKD